MPNAGNVGFWLRWLATAALGTAGVLTHGESSAMELRLTVSQGPLSRNEPVVATLSLRNASDESVFLNLGRFGKRSVNVNVVGPQSDVRYVTAEDARTCFAECLHSPLGELGAGQEVAAHLLLGRWHRLTEPGRYKVHVELQRNAFVDPRESPTDHGTMRDGVLYISAEHQAWLEEPVYRSNTVTIDIGARDERRLRTVAETLWDRAKEGDAAAQLTLVWMIDPVAVPWLDRLLRPPRDPRRGGFPTYAVEVLAAIERAATPEAVDVLTRLGASDVFMRDSVLRSLRKIAQDPTARPAARERAEVAIQEGEFGDMHSDGLTRP